MSKNRKNQPASLRWGPVLKAVLVCLALTGFGVGYVWQKAEISRLGQEIKVREIRLGQLIEENEQRRKQLAKMRSPAFLEMRIRELNLGLCAPLPAQVWRLNEPQVPMPVVEDETRLASHSDDSAALQ